MGKQIFNCVHLKQKEGVITTSSFLYRKENPYFFTFKGIKSNFLAYNNSVRELRRYEV